MDDSHAFLIQKHEALLDEQQKLQFRLFKIRHDISDVRAAGKVFGVELCGHPENSTVREKLLEILSDGQTYRVRQLRQHFGDIHDKTIGMTLYKLMKEGLVEKPSAHEWKIATKHDVEVPPIPRAK